MELVSEVAAVEDPATVGFGTDTSLVNTVRMINQLILSIVAVILIIQTQYVSVIEVQWRIQGFERGVKLESFRSTPNGDPGALPLVKGKNPPGNLECVKLNSIAYLIANVICKFAGVLWDGVAQSVLSP